MVNHGALVGVLGSAGSENVQGETQKKMDILSNDVCINSNEWAGHLAAMASEEMDDMYPMDTKMQAKGLGGKLRLLYEANPISFIV